MQDTYNISETDYKHINKRAKVNVGDILFGMIGTIGNPVLVNQEGFAIKNVALIKTFKNKLGIFILHYLEGEKVNKYFFKHNAGGTQKFISLGLVRNIPISYPHSSIEQQKIGAFFSKLDQRIELASQKVESLKEQKRGLLQKMFV